MDERLAIAHNFISWMQVSKFWRDFTDLNVREITPLYIDENFPIRFPAVRALSLRFCELGGQAMDAILKLPQLVELCLPSDSLLDDLYAAEDSVALVRPLKQSTQVRNGFWRKQFVVMRKALYWSSLAIFFINVKGRNSIFRFDSRSSGGRRSDQAVLLFRLGLWARQPS